MGVDLKEIIETSSDTYTDEPILTHIVGPEGDKSGAARVTEAMVNGTVVTALCGYSWVPSRNPQNHPPCEECLEIVEFAKDMRS